MPCNPMVTVFSSLDAAQESRPDSQGLAVIDFHASKTESPLDHTNLGHYMVGTAPEEERNTESGPKIFTVGQLQSQAPYWLTIPILRRKQQLNSDSVPIWLVTSKLIPEDLTGVEDRTIQTRWKIHQRIGSTLAISLSPIYCQNYYSLSSPVDMIGVDHLISAIHIDHRRTWKCIIGPGRTEHCLLGNCKVLTCGSNRLTSTVVTSVDLSFVNKTVHFPVLMSLLNFNCHVKVPISLC
ncbi:hypothetical protein GQ43DRAFT_300709 [Delitschia confertaspora ATCC 74209]|uniref:Uncharacterized protein n=1 Tax=Delitschia confertaspora ATCC 74209 TaxID=1513339 RepID=A0A9P4JYK8_9PLEO|nr:hypothetical protein GQ43DRAFT_300709 [Delitschia confertaspora ATCC 74209]